jgi:hypothetical protein
VFQAIKHEIDEAQFFVGLYQMLWGTFTLSMNALIITLYYIPPVNRWMSILNYLPYRLILVVQAITYIVQAFLPLFKLGIYDWDLHLETFGFDYDRFADVTKMFLFFDMAAILTTLYASDNDSLDL